VKRPRFLPPLATLAEDTSGFQRTPVTTTNAGSGGLTWLPRQATPVPSADRRLTPPVDTPECEVA